MVESRLKCMLTFTRKGKPLPLALGGLSSRQMPRFVWWYVEGGAAPSLF